MDTSIISYELSEQVYNKVLYLKVTLRNAHQRVSRTGEKELLSALMEEEKRFRQRFFPNNKDSFDVCRVIHTRAFEIVKAIGALGSAMHGGTKVIVDPFTPLHVFLEAHKGDHALLLTGKWRTVRDSGPLEECAWIFAGSPAWAIKQRVLHPLSGLCERAWIERVFPQPSLLEGPKAVECINAMQDEDFFSDIVWSGQLAAAHVEPVPFLALTDRHGAFANLLFDYGPYGTLAAHDPMRTSWRNHASEQLYEKDLLETDFLKKCVDASHYYCPLDKVSKSLSFLLEIGWKVFDHRHRQVVRQSSEAVQAELSGDHIVVRGQIHYGEHSADLKDFIGAFTRKDKFIDLSDAKVGLLDAAQSEKWEGLSEHEVIADGIAIKKQRIGVLPTLCTATHNLDDLLRSLPQGWQSTCPTIGNAFCGKLFAYQEEGLKWLAFLNAGGCSGLLADAMGLGKTVQVLAFLSQLPIFKPCLIVVPTSLLFNWKREFERFLPTVTVITYEGKTRMNSRQACLCPQLILTSYALLRQDAEFFKEIDYQLVILDEAQTIKNPESQIAQVAFSLKSAMRLAITGTPIENRLQDIWALFHFLMPGLLKERSAFNAALHAGGHAGGHATGSDARYLQQIRRVIRPFLLRRKKEDVGLELPPKVEQLIWVDMTDEQRTLYEQWLHRTKAGLIQKVTLDGKPPHRMEILEAILRLRQLCLHPWLACEHAGEGDFFHLSGKCERLFLDLAEVIEENKKVIIYSQFTTMLHLIRREVANKGWSHVYLDGTTKDREGVVRTFQEDPALSIFLISLKAGGVGLNLTAADYVFLFDPWWNEAVEQQAIDRAHRVGRTQTVIARRYVTALSIEEKISHLKAHKLNLAQGLFEECSSALSEKDLMDLIVS